VLLQWSWIGGGGTLGNPNRVNWVNSMDRQANWVSGNSTDRRAVQVSRVGNTEQKKGVPCRVANTESWVMGNLANTESQVTKDLANTESRVTYKSANTDSQVMKNLANTENQVMQDSGGGAGN
jgi:hypothetical protein